MSNNMNPAASAAKEPTFTKATLVNSTRFRNNRDLISALLADGIEYTMSEVERMIRNYLKGKVK